jgi:hypothetical protein
MVIASPELGCAYDAAGALPGEKHAPSNAAAVERQQRVIAARLTALAEKDPLKPVSTGGRVDRRPAWRLAAPWAGAGACLACAGAAPNPKSAKYCRCEARHGPGVLDAAVLLFRPGCPFKYGKVGKEVEGTVVCYNPLLGSYDVRSGDVAEVKQLYLSFGRFTTATCCAEGVGGARVWCALCEQWAAAPTLAEPEAAAAAAAAPTSEAVLAAAQQAEQEDGEALPPPKAEDKPPAAQPRPRRKVVAHDAAAAALPQLPAQSTRAAKAAVIDRGARATARKRAHSPPTLRAKSTRVAQRAK